MDKKDVSNTIFLTGMRGYAALWVFLIHVGGFLNEKHWLLKAIVSHGALGVMIFFVLSSFCITLSIHKDNTFIGFRYICKRIFRIVPLYYIVLFIAFVLGGSSYYKALYNVSTYNLQDLFYHLSFLTLFDHQYIHRLAGFTWNIPIEFFYYLLLPLAFFIFKKYRFLLGITLLLGVLLYFYPQYHLPFYNNYQADYSLERYLIFYAIGLLFFFEIYYTKIHKAYILNLFIIFISIGTLYMFIDIHDKFFLLILVFLFCYYLLFDSIMDRFHIKNNIKIFLNNFNGLLPVVFIFVYLFSGPSYPQLIVGLWAGVLILSCMKRDAISRFIFENKVIIYLGEISYSIYLIHALLRTYMIEYGIFANNLYLRFLIIFIITIIVSSITYKIIEKPFIRLGRTFSLRTLKVISK